MRLTIDHVTRYRFDRPRCRSLLLRMRPTDSDQQTIASWRIDLDCDARLKKGRDGFGNETTMLYAEAGIEEIAIAVSGEVLTNRVGDMVSGIDDPLPPPLFLRSTALTRADAALRDFAEQADGRSPRDIVDALMAAMQARFTVGADRPAAHLSASAAFARATASPGDMAQILIAALRVRGIPARYVSGYSPRAPGDGARAGPHGWVEAYLADDGWCAVDPSAGTSADGYVRVAVALDAAGAAPVAGLRGDDALAMDVSVARIGGEE